MDGRSRAVVVAFAVACAAGEDAPPTGAGSTGVDTSTGPGTSASAMGSSEASSGDAGSSGEASSGGQETGSIPATCVDGVDCPCDRLADGGDPLFDPELLFCEDFESPALGDGGKGWSDLYGPPSDGCFVNGDDWNTNGTIEGTCPTCCINVIADGECEVPGEDDCVFHGGQSLGHRLQPGFTGGIVGTAFFPSTVRRFGVTYALRYSPNFVDPSPAMKTNEFGNGLHCILGCATTNNFGSNLPFQAVILGTSIDAGGTALVGQAAPNDGFYNFSPQASDYAWRGTHGPGQWVCHQLHFDGWGTAAATIRYFIDGQLVTHVEGVDLTVVQGDPDGIGSFAWNHYYNDGYVGPDVAYRYEDNFVVTGGPEPVPCDAIGF
jgi:hypothetical protein